MQEGIGRDVGGGGGAGSRARPKPRRRVCEEDFRDLVESLYADARPRRPSRGPEGGPPQSRFEGWTYVEREIDIRVAREPRA